MPAEIPPGNQQDIFKHELKLNESSGLRASFFNTTFTLVPAAHLHTRAILLYAPVNTILLPAAIIFVCRRSANDYSRRSAATASSSSWPLRQDQTPTDNRSSSKCDRLQQNALQNQPIRRRRKLPHRRPPR